MLCSLAVPGIGDEGIEVIHKRRCLCRAFDNLRDVRGLEYELDFVTNRANRDLQVSTWGCASSLQTVFASVLSWTFKSILYDLGVDGPIVTDPRTGCAMMQAVREKAAIQAMEFQREREQLMAELSKAKGRGGLSDKSRVPLGSKENVRA